MLSVSGPVKFEAVKDAASMAREGNMKANASYYGTKNVLLVVRDGVKVAKARKEIEEALLMMY